MITQFKKIKRAQKAIVIGVVAVVLLICLPRIGYDKSFSIIKINNVDSTYSNMNTKNSTTYEINTEKVTDEIQTRGIEENPSNRTQSGDIEEDTSTSETTDSLQDINTTNEPQTVKNYAAGTSEAVLEEIQNEITNVDSQLDNDVLADLYICGDSLASGFSVYNKLPKDHVFYKVGIPCFKMFDMSYDYNEDQAVLLSSIKDIQPKYLAMIYGINDLGYDNTADKFAETYMEKVKALQEKSPNTIFLVTAITPIDNVYSTNEKINKYNKALYDAVKNEDSSKIRFVNLNKLLVDSSGKLSSTYNGGDGIHISNSAYDVILDKFQDYILTRIINKE